VGFPQLDCVMLKSSSALSLIDQLAPTNSAVNNFISFPPSLTLYTKIGTRKDLISYPFNDI
jgi:hypothetical protein